jgi:hypothetical protein
MNRSILISIVAVWATSAALLAGAGDPPLPPQAIDDPFALPDPSKPDLKAPRPDPQPAGKPKPKPGAKPEAQPAKERVLRDPTLPGPTLRTLVAKPGAGPVAIPSVELKGRILADPRIPMVALAVGGQLHMVAEGTKISIASGEIVVSRVTDKEVQLQILPLQQILTLH